MTIHDPEVLGRRVTRPSVSLRLGPLVVVGVLGLVLVVGHVIVELGDDPPRLSGLMLEVGAGLLLFAVLLVVQSRFVERAISATRALTEEEMRLRQQEGTANELTPGDFHEELGPMAVARAVVRDLADGNLREAWNLFDPNFRRCRALAWVFNNRSQLGLGPALSADAEAVVDLITDAVDEPAHLRDEFFASESRLYADALGGYDDDRYGWSQRRRVVGPHHELVLAVPLPIDAPHGVVVDSATIVPNAIKVLVSAHVIDDQTLYLVASINSEAAPLPTWPPTWWLTGDPAAVAAHPGISGSRRVPRI